MENEILGGWDLCLPLVCTVKVHIQCLAFTFSLAHCPNSSPWSLFAWLCGSHRHYAGIKEADHKWVHTAGFHLHEFQKYKKQTHDETDKKSGSP